MESKHHDYDNDNTVRNDVLPLEHHTNNNGAHDDDNNNDSKNDTCDPIF